MEIVMPAVKRTAQQLVSLSLWFCVAFVALLCYWLNFDNKVPMAVIDAPAAFISDPDHHDSTVEAVSAGQHVYHARQVCFSKRNPTGFVPALITQRKLPTLSGDKPIKGIARARIVDGFIVFMPEVTFDVEEGCFNFVTPLKIPSNLAPGFYTYNSSIEFFRNPLQHLTGGVVVDEKAVPFLVK